MAKRSVLIWALLAVAFSATGVFAKHHTAEERGKAHFDNKAFAGGSKSCSTCHPGGSGLEGAGAKKSFFLMGAKQGSLEEAINFCVVNANKGKALAVDSAEMQELAAYIRSLGKK